jgi:hypothetical protein
MCVRGNLEAFYDVVVFGVMADPEPDPGICLAKGQCSVAVADPR